LITNLHQLKTIRVFLGQRARTDFYCLVCEKSARHRNLACEITRFIISLASKHPNYCRTPALLVFHRELHLPSAPFIPPSVVRTADITLTEIADNIKLTDDLIRANTELSFTSADKFYNRPAEVKTFQIGQKVLLYNENVPPNRMRKLHIFYTPVEITDWPTIATRYAMLRRCDLCLLKSTLVG